jgi:putative oxidoreductase
VDAQRRDLTTSIGLLILRLGIGVYLATHGWGKLQMVLAGDLDQFGDPIGLGSGASLVLVTIAEFFCALLVVLGLATRFAAVPPVIAMAVAAFVVHAADPWTAGRGYELYVAGTAESWASKEPALLYLVAFLALIFTGAGRYSLDALIRKRRGASTRP